MKSRIRINIAILILCTFVAYAFVSPYFYDLKLDPDLISRVDLRVKKASFSHAEKDIVRFDRKLSISDIDMIQDIVYILESSISRKKYFWQRKIARTTSAVEITIAYKDKTTSSWKIYSEAYNLSEIEWDEAKLYFSNADIAVYLKDWITLNSTAEF